LSLRSFPTRRSSDLFGESDVCGPVDRDLVVVVVVDETAETQMTRKGSRLGRDALHQVAVRDEAEGPVIDEILAHPGPEMCLGDRHADPGAETLAERAGRHLDSEMVVDLGMTGGVGSPLAELTEILEGKREPGQMQH